MESTLTCPGHFVQINRRDGCRCVACRRFNQPSFRAAGKPCLAVYAKYVKIGDVWWVLESWLTDAGRPKLAYHPDGMMELYCRRAASGNIFSGANAAAFATAYVLDSLRGKSALHL